MTTAKVKVLSMKKRVLPLIKENRIDRLTEVLSIFDKFPYDREKQSEHILSLYLNKTAKSVFRGMAIPSLRYMGLIIGYENLIRLSANGRILVKAKKRGTAELLRAWRAIILELDINKFGFMSLIKKEKSLNSFENRLAMVIEGPNQKQIRERIKRWMKILFDSRLLSEADKKIRININNLKRAKNDLRFSDKKSKFESMLLAGYKAFPFKESAGIVDIADLREYVAAMYYKKYKMILTEAQFDELLRILPFITKKYIISLGHTMGAEEKLFRIKAEYYRTISIDFPK
jgi:hypothetical protein